MILPGFNSNLKVLTHRQNSSVALLMCGYCSRYYSVQCAAWHSPTAFQDVSSCVGLAALVLREFLFNSPVFTLWPLLEFAQCRRDIWWPDGKAVTMHVKGNNFGYYREEPISS